MKLRTAIWTAGEARAAFAAAPATGLSELAPSGPLVVVAPHPDDETLGCGGLMAEAGANGRQVIVALMTDGAASHPQSPRFNARERGAVRLAELRSALAALSDAPIEVLTFGASDGGLSKRVAEAGRWLQRVVGAAEDATIFVTWEADHHPDHKAAYAAASWAAEATGAALWAYPVWSLMLPDEANIGPPRRVAALDVAHQTGRKRSAIACHASQLDASVMEDPTGFLLRPEDLERHAGGREVFLAVRERV